MMQIGYDAAEDLAICAAKQWPGRQITAGFMLFGFGTIPAPDAATDSGIHTALEIGAGELQICMDRIAGDEGGTDVLFGAAKLIDALCRTHSRVRKMQAMIGQGIYLGGVVTYMVGQQYVLLPFGGGSAHTWDGTNLIRQGGSAFAPGQDGLIRDAIGCGKKWSGLCWQGVLAPGKRLLCMTGEPDLEKIIPHLQRDLGNHANTLAMLLRREQERMTTLPTAVMEYYNGEE